MTDKPDAEPAEKPAPAVEYEAIPLTASEQRTHDAMTAAEKKEFAEMSAEDQKATLDADDGASAGTADEQKAYAALSPEAKKAFDEKMVAGEREAEADMSPADKAKFDAMGPEHKKAELARRAHEERKAPHVSVGCSLPSGMSIEVKGKTYLLKGPENLPLGPGQRRPKFGMTKIPAAVWDYWFAEHADFAPVVAGTIIGPAPTVVPKEAMRLPTPREQAAMKPQDPPAT